MSTLWEHPVVQAMARGREPATGAAAPSPWLDWPVNFSAASDASFFEGAGIPSIVFGLGDLRLAHSKDEWVSIDEVVIAAKALAGCVLE